MLTCHFHHGHRIDFKSPNFPGNPATMQPVQDWNVTLNGSTVWPMGNTAGEVHFGRGSNVWGGMISQVVPLQPGMIWTVNYSIHWTGVAMTPNPRLRCWIWDVNSNSIIHSVTNNASGTPTPVAPPGPYTATGPIRVEFYDVSNGDGTNTDLVLSGVKLVVNPPAYS